MRLWHTRTQQPVGQGGFHTGRVETHGDEAFHYVYDCGSENSAPLREAIGSHTEVLDGIPIDVLFLSHLDEDHVSGLDELLVMNKVHTAVLPYLSPVARLILVAQAVSDLTLRGNLLSLWCDPTGWLAARGVERVIYVTAAEPPEGWGPGDRQVSPPDNRDNADLSGLTLVLPDMNIKAAQTAPANEYSGVAHVMPCSQPLPLSLRGARSLINWQFVTFVHPEGQREDEFQKAVQKLLGRTYAKGFEIDQRALLAALQDPSQRDRLAACYTIIRRDRNLTSLSLYSGPIVRCNAASIRSSSGIRSSDEGWTPTGWIGTGDSNLKRVVRRRQFAKHFEGLRDFTFTFMLPHHGSALNFDTELLRFGFLASISAGRHNAFDHPSDEVLCRLDPDRTHITTEENSSALHETVRLA